MELTENSNGQGLVLRTQASTERYLLSDDKDLTVLPKAPFPVVPAMDGPPKDLEMLVLYSRHFSRFWEFQS